MKRLRRGVRLGSQHEMRPRPFGIIVTRPPGPLDVDYAKLVYRWVVKKRKRFSLPTRVRRTCFGEKNAFWAFWYSCALQIFDHATFRRPQKIVYASGPNDRRCADSSHVVHDKHIFLHCLLYGLRIRKYDEGIIEWGGPWRWEIYKSEVVRVELWTVGVRGEKRRTRQNGRTFLYYSFIPCTQQYAR